MGFKYETHLHTCEASACASCSAKEILYLYKEHGYSGIIITNHFFNGNTNIDSSLSWEKQIELFCKPYEIALAESEKLGIHVFFGWEYNDNGVEFLTYGLDKKWLLNNQSVLNWNIEKYFDEVHKSGGFISHAHPFRKASYIPDVRLFTDKIDAVEVINVSNREKQWNVMALEYANENNLLSTSGSDIHHISTFLGGGMEFEQELFSIEEFILAVKNRNYKLLGE